jgi:hypothetical protein
VLWLAFTHPIAALIVLVLILALMIWLIPKIWRFIFALIRKVAALFGRPDSRRSGRADV